MGECTPRRGLEAALERVDAVADVEAEREVTGFDLELDEFHAVVGHVASQGHVVAIELEPRTAAEGIGQAQLVAVLGLDGSFVAGVVVHVVAVEVALDILAVDVAVESHIDRARGIGADEGVAVDILGVADGQDPAVVRGDVGVGRTDLHLSLATELSGDGITSEAIGEALVGSVHQADRLLVDVLAIEHGVDSDGDLGGVDAGVAGVDRGIDALAAHQGREEHERAENAEHDASKGVGVGSRRKCRAAVRSQQRDAQELRRDYLH